MRWLNLALLLIASTHQAASQALNLTLIHINDHHSHLEESSFDLRGDSIPSGLASNTSTVRVFMGKPFALTVVTQ